MTLRFRLIGIAFLLSVIALVGRLFFWQIVQGQQLSSEGRLQQFSNKTLGALRGSILAADGTWLAASTDAWLLYASRPQLTESARTIANELAPLLTESSGDEEIVIGEVIRIEELLNREDLVWIPLKHKLSTEQKKNIEALEIEGLGFELQEQRLYPEASAAAHLLGFLGKDTEGNDKGYFGLEGFYDVTLAGKEGFLQRESSAIGLPIIVGSSKEIDALHGVDLLTHIDKRIQVTIEEKLADALVKYGAIQGTIVAMDAKTGGILAMAALPSYDPKDYSAFGDEYFKNPIISDAYEPGSIFKPIVMAAGLDAGVINSETTCDICDQPYKVDKYVIRTWNNEYNSNSTMTDVIKHSDNVGMVFIGNRLGADKLYDYLAKFGFGELTNIDLQGESSPAIRERGTWNIVDLATATFGQGIAVTPIQMVKAVGIIANDGKAVTPQVVNKFRLEDWEQDIGTEVGEHIISKEAADDITAMMVEAVKNGEAQWAVPKGYSIAGKTGTAQIAVSGHYDDEKTYASFIGFAPAVNPRIVMLVTLREPQSSPWASETAAPLWFDIAREVFPYLGIQPEN